MRSDLTLRLPGEGEEEEFLRAHRATSPEVPSFLHYYEDAPVSELHKRHLRRFLDPATRMKLFARVSLLLVSLLVVSATVVAAEWRGIVPIRSTRDDVLRVFSQCEDKKERCSFALGDHEVMIVFSGWQRAFSSCPIGVPKDTVLSVFYT